jgi:hypothetical protein
LLVIYFHETRDNAEKAYELVEVCKKLALVLLGLLEYINKRLEVREVFDSRELEVHDITNIIDKF